MCCLTQDPTNPYTVTIVDCCTLKISNADGTLIDTFNLNDLDYQVANGILYLKDGVNTRTINVADAPAIFGVADIAAVLAFIDTAVTDCKCVTPPSVPVTLDVLNCDGTTTPTVFDQAPAKVEIVQTKPLVICKSSVDFEIGCSSVDGRTIVRTYVQDENGVITSQVFEQDGVTPVTDGSVLVKCGFDIEDVEFCYQDQTNAEIRYRQIVFVNAETSAVIGTIWLDGTGTAIAAPANVEPCADADEIDLIYTNWLPICVDGVQWYVAEKLTFNNVSAIEGVAEKIYKQGADGAIVTVAPIGTIVDGVCKLPSHIPHTYGCIGTRSTDTIPNSYGFDLPNDFGTTNATDTYLHAIEDVVNGILYWFPPATAQPSTPTVCTNVTGIQTWLDSIGAPITYTVNAFNELVLFYDNPGDENNWTFWLGTSTPDNYTNKLTPTLHDLQSDEVSYQQVQVVKYENTDGTFADRFFVPSDGALVEVFLNPENTFNFGTCPEKETCKKEIFATHQRFYEVPAGTGTKCVGVQEIKEKDSCTGVETYRYVTEDGNGNLVDASLFILNFDENNIIHSCPEDPKIEYIPHVSGCIRRKTGTITAVCGSTTTTYEFSDTDMVGFTITANDGNGNYTMIQEQSNTIAHDKFLALLQNVSQTNARTVEDIGPGFIIFNFWSENISNVIDLSSTEVQFDIHVEAGVSDTPVALTAPCIDPIPDSTYQNSATTLRGIYDPVPLNTQQPNSGTALLFTITNYDVSYEVIGGSDIIIPAKQIIYKDVDGTIIEEYRSIGNISSIIIFNPLTDSFSINCDKDPLPNIQEKEVCGTIDGSADSYELIKVYTRDILTGISTILHYEDNFGNIITGTVAEVCCGCDSVCDAPLQLLEDVNFRCQSYGKIGGGSFTSKLLNIDWGNDTYHYYGIISPPAGTVPVTINGSSGVIWSGNINVASSISNLISGLNANDPNVNYANGTYWKTDENGGIRNRTTHTTLVVNGVTYNPTATSGNNWPCTNHFPVECYTEIAVSTNAGGSWTTVKPKGLGFTLNSVGDVIIRDDGYGLGFANLIDHVNPYIIPYGVQVKTSINNSWMTEWSSTVNHSDVKYKVLYYFIPVADADCTPDPVDYENYFTAINIMASDGDVNLMAPATNANFTGINLNTTSVPNNNSYCESF